MPDHATAPPTAALVVLPDAPPAGVTAGVDWATTEPTMTSRPYRVTRLGWSGRRWSLPTRSGGWFGTAHDEFLDRGARICADQPRLRDPQ
jgi:hypothetical protein